MWLAIAIVVIILLVIIYLITAYNGLIRRRNQIENAWSQIDVQLKRRLDLIPNLVETVKGYAAHERETLDAVIRARNAAISAPDTPHAQAEAQGHRLPPPLPPAPAHTSHGHAVLPPGGPRGPLATSSGQPGPRGAGSRPPASENRGRIRPAGPSPSWSTPGVLLR